jgi:hypothetical protein
VEHRGYAECSLQIIGLCKLGHDKCAPDLSVTVHFNYVRKLKTCLVSVIAAPSRSTAFFFQENNQPPPPDRYDI